MLTTTKRTRKQIEQHIEKCAESIQKNGLEIGRDLIEIRDDELWADEYDSWNQYLKDRVASLVGKSFAQATNLIRAAEISTRLPVQVQTSGLELHASALTELGRLAPHAGNEGSGKDYSKLRKQDVARVIKAATEIAKETAPPDKKSEATPSVRDIRKAVDEELGIDRAVQAKQSKAKRERESQIDLDDYLRRIKGTSEGWLSVLGAVPAEAWEDYASELDEAATALESLAKYLRE